MRRWECVGRGFKGCTNQIQMEIQIQIKIQKETQIQILIKPGGKLPLAMGWRECIGKRWVRLQQEEIQERHNRFSWWSWCLPTAQTIAQRPMFVFKNYANTCIIEFMFVILRSTIVTTSKEDLQWTAEEGGRWNISQSQSATFELNSFICFLYKCTRITSNGLWEV